MTPDHTTGHCSQPCLRQQRSLEPCWYADLQNKKFTPMEKTIDHSTRLTNHHLLLLSSCVPLPGPHDRARGTFQGFAPSRSLASSLGSQLLFFFLVEVLGVARCASLSLADGWNACQNRQWGCRLVNSVGCSIVFSHPLDRAEFS